MKVGEITAKEIAQLRGIYEQRHEAMKQAEKQLKTFVSDFMEKNDMMSNADDVLEMIGHLPQGYLRFKMYETYYELRDAQDQEQSSTPEPHEELNMSM